MKLKKTIKAKINKTSLKDQADELGKEYAKQREVEKEAVKQKNKYSEKIKKIAAIAGEPVKKMRLIIGDKYAVGFYLRVIGSKVDTDKAKALLPPDIFKACTVKFLDVDKLAHYVEAGKVSPALFKKMVILGKPTKYVVVKTKAELEAELKKDQEAEESDQTNSF